MWNMPKIEFLYGSSFGTISTISADWGLRHHLDLLWFGGMGGNLSNNDSIADMKLSNFRKEEGSLIHDAAKSLTCFYNFLPYSLLS